MKLYTGFIQYLSTKINLNKLLIAYDSISKLKRRSKMSVGVVLEDVLNDALLLGSLAASIFVKNPNNQTTAAAVINAVAQLVQVIDGQISGSSSTSSSSSSASVSSTPAASTASTTTTVAVD